MEKYICTHHQEASNISELKHSIKFIVTEGVHLFYLAFIFLSTVWVYRFLEFLEFNSRFHDRVKLSNGT